jgi:mannose-1-phosphate guanylyltransferase
MKALLLAAGLGTRLRPITDSIPKCLVPINGRALLDYWLDLLLGQGIERVLINTHYMADEVRRHIAVSPWADSVDLVHEPELLGTGGTILQNCNYFEDQAFFVAHSDNLTLFSLRQFQDSHRSRARNADITMMTFETDNPSSCGIVTLDDHGVVTGFYEKQPDPPGRLANGAVYIFEPSILEEMAGLEKSGLDISIDILPRHLNRIQTFHNNIYLRDIGTPESLAAAEREYPAIRQRLPTGFLEPSR